jgi:metal-responsive CopG/Arc/MetJ family transcriptional regulator
MQKQHLGTITIMVTNRQVNSEKLNKTLSENSHIILTRLGVNIEPRCISNCSGLITIVVKGTLKQINDLTNILNKLYGIVAKSCVITK